MRPVTSPSREELVVIDQYLRPLAAPVIAFSKREKRSTYWVNWLAESRLYEPLFYLAIEEKCPDDFSTCEKRFFRLFRRALDGDWAVPQGDTSIKEFLPKRYYERYYRDPDLFIGDHGIDPVWWDKMSRAQRLKSHLVRRLLQIEWLPRESAESGPGVKEKLYEAILERGDEVAKMQLAAHFLTEGRAPLYWKERLFQSAKELGVRRTLAYALDPKDKGERELLELLSHDLDEGVRMKIADKIQFPHMLEDPNPVVQMKAVQGLPLTREQVSRLIQDPSPAVRHVLLERALLSGEVELTIEELLYFYNDDPVGKKARFKKLLQKEIMKRMGKEKGKVVLTFMEID